MNVIYVDDEKPAINNFRLTTENFTEIAELETFQNGEDVLEFIKEHIVDVAFLDMEMPGIHGLELAKALKKHDPKMRIIFVTAFSQYALDAWSVDATGYLMKPYTAAEIHKELAKCTYKPLPSHRVMIETIPEFRISVDGMPLHTSGNKPKELLALLVDRGERGVSVGEAISCLWPDRKADNGMQSLFRMTWKRLADSLENAGVGDIIATTDGRRCLKTEKVECDLYHILAGEREAIKKYNGEYLREYEWAEDKNAQIYQMVCGE